MEPAALRRVLNASYCSPAPDTHCSSPPPLPSLSPCNMYLSSPPPPVCQCHTFLFLPPFFLHFNLFCSPFPVSVVLIANFRSSCLVSVTFTPVQVHFWTWSAPPSLPPLPVCPPPWQSGIMTGWSANQQPASAFMRCSEALGQTPPPTLCSSQWQEASPLPGFSRQRFKEPADDERQRSRESFQVGERSAAKVVLQMLTCYICAEIVKFLCCGGKIGARRPAEDDTLTLEPQDSPESRRKRTSRNDLQQLRDLDSVRSQRSPTRAHAHAFKHALNTRTDVQEKGQRAHKPGGRIPTKGGGDPHTSTLGGGQDSAATL